MQKKTSNQKKSKKQLKKQILKAWEKSDLSDDYIFGKVMEEESILVKVLSAITNERIGKIENNTRTKKYGSNKTIKRSKI